MRVQRLSTFKQRITKTVMEDSGCKKLELIMWSAKYYCKNTEFGHQATFSSTIEYLLYFDQILTDFTLGLLLLILI